MTFFLGLWGMWGTLFEKSSPCDVLAEYRPKLGDMAARCAAISYPRKNVQTKKLTFVRIKFASHKGQP